MKLTKSHWLLIVFLILAVYVILPQVGDFRHSLPLLRRASPLWLGRAIMASLLTYLAAAGTYCWLAFERLSFGRTALVELASTFANRLLPAGIGNLGVNYRYLRRYRHSQAQATAVLAVNNLIGVVGHLLLLALLLALYGREVPGSSFSLPGRGWWVAATTVIIIALILTTRTKLRHRGQILFKHSLHQVANYRRRPARLWLALMTSLAMTLSNVICFWCCLKAFNLPISLLTALLVFSFGVAIATATPTPGGLGAAEAALIAGLLAFNMTQPQALAAVIVYRLIYYWFGLLLGALSWPLIQRLRYLT